MSKTKATMLAILSLVVGLAAGGWGVSRIMGGFMERAVVATSVSHVVHAVIPLKDLRAGNTTGAVEYLEMNLDGGLIDLGEFVRDGPEPPNNALGDALKGIEMARNYRAEYPRTNNSPEMAEAIARTFSELEKYE